MAVPIQDTISQFFGNGETTVYAYDFYLLSQHDLIVRVDGERLSSGYTVSGIGSQSGGYVTFDLPPVNGASVLFERIVSLERSTEYQQNGDFEAQVVNEDFDRLWMAQQQQARNVDTAIRIPVDETLEEKAALTLLPPARQRAGKTIVFDEAGHVGVSRDDYVNQTANVDALANAAAESEAAAAASLAETRATAEKLIKDADHIASGLVKAAAASEQTALRAATRAELAAASVESATLLGVCTGEPDALTVRFAAPVSALTNGLTIVIRARYRNESIEPTLQIDDFPAKTIVKLDNQLLRPGDIAGEGMWMQLSFDAALDAWVLQNPARNKGGDAPGAALRNVVLSGRQIDGEPAYVATHEPYWMPMFKSSLAVTFTERPGSVADVFCSGIAGNNYGPEIPLVNQKSRAYAGRFTATNAAGAFFWGVSLKEPQAFTMVEINYYAAITTPQNLQIQATNEDNWDNPVEISGVIEEKQKMPNTTMVTRDYARRYWFEHNTEKYRHWRLLVSPVTGTTVNTTYFAVRFFRHPDRQAGMLGKNDLVLCASEATPFKASIANGLEGDITVELDEPVIIPGALLSELSRNYIYLVPDTDEGKRPDYVDPARAIRLEEQQAWLVGDTRKINYGTESQLTKKCWALYRCDAPASTATAATTFGADLGGWARNIRRTNATISEEDNFRGSKSAIVFPSTTNTTSLVVPTDSADTSNWLVNTVEPKGSTTVGAGDFTFEVDLRYTGPNQDNNDNPVVIFDFGMNAETSFALVYYHRRGHFTVNVMGKIAFKWPCVLDNAWHSLALSHRNGNIYLHLDGRCLGALKGFPAVSPGSAFWTLGRWVNTKSQSWTGKFSAFRWTVGDALYAGDDYDPAEVFYTSAIAHNTLWYDHAEGIVKTWDAAQEEWKRTPMCPIAQVDTFYQEHLHSESPRGSEASYAVQNVKTFTASNGSALRLFNFGGSAAAWATAATALTTDHWAQIELVRPMAFSELRLVESGTTAIWTFPPLFIWQGSHDGEDWVDIIDRSEFIRDGDPHNAIATFDGISVWWFGGYKRFPVTDTTPYLFYRLYLPKKSDIPYYNSATTHSVRIQLPLLGGTPDIDTVRCQPIGGTYTCGPFYLAAKATVDMPVPFGGAPYTVDGYSIQVNNGKSQMRQLGNYWIVAEELHGDYFYSTDECVTLTAGTVAADFTLTMKRTF